MKLPSNHIPIVALLAAMALAACQPKPAPAPDTAPTRHQHHQPPTQNINRDIIIVVPPGDHAAARQDQDDRP